MSACRSLGLLSTALFFLVVPASGVERAGSEFLINSHTPLSQSSPSVAANEDGTFVVVWTSSEQEDSGPFTGGVFGQRFASDGSSLGSEFQVNTYTIGFQSVPDVAVDADLDFFVVWNSFDDQDGNASGVFGQRYSSSGAPLGGELQVNSYTLGSQSSPSVATDSDGDAVVVWASVQDGYSTGVFGRRYSSSGAAVASEFQVNTYTYLVQDSADVGIDTAGNFVVVWISERYWQFTLTNNVFGQRHASSGAPIGGEFQINSYTTTEQYSPSVAVEADGDFVVVWKTGTSKILGRRYSSDGTTVGSEFQVSTYPSSVKFSPQVAVQSTGDFVVAWTSNTQDGSVFFPGGVFGQHLSSAGAPVGTEFRVNTFTVNGQYMGGVAAAGDGRFVITWYAGAVDGSGSGIVGQRFVTPCPIAPADGCRTALKSLLSLKNNGNDARDKLIFKWMRGQSTLDPEFGNPDLTRTYRLCIYDANGSFFKADVPPDAVKWDDLQYKDSNGTADGIRKIILKSSDDDAAKVIVKGKGENLPDLTLGSLPVPITVQVINDETNLCFESVFGANDILINDTGKLKAKF